MVSLVSEVSRRAVRAGRASSCTGRPCPPPRHRGRHSQVAHPTRRPRSQGAALAQRAAEGRVASWRSGRGPEAAAAETAGAEEEDSVEAQGQATRVAPGMTAGAKTAVQGAAVLGEDTPGNSRSRRTGTARSRPQRSRHRRFRKTGHKSKALVARCTRRLPWRRRALSRSPYVWKRFSLATTPDPTSAASSNTVIATVKKCPSTASSQKAIRC